MGDSGQASPGVADPVISSGNAPLVFISHDHRDAALAEAFSKLLKSVSAGMIKCFRSSDRKTADGIDFGEEWYKRLMDRLQATSDVICLFTERSLDRPWLLFEAGVAKGKLDTPVVGIALGVPLSRVSAGPFYQFQNMDDGEEDLTKLVYQLARRVPGLELDSDVVRVQVQAFKTSEASILKSLADAGAAKKSTEREENSVAKIIEELKTLPSRVAERLDPSEHSRRKANRRVHPMMLNEIVRASRDPADPTPLLLVAGLIKDELPWLHELVMNAYRAASSGDAKAIGGEMKRLVNAKDFLANTTIMNDLITSHEQYMLAMEVPEMVEWMLRRINAERVSRKPSAKKT
ncbi:toll/interleukin-1 receptor domain-containing protein [Lysobacter sp. A6]|uniref:Toll/interleukin-1 receptor domain-containing protein n=1 Tax=Noviluteimonas lactosilytica TaxID=2888523 RepID=A0ABS8JGY6_9GAMM|nr:toll/interleukin-1 receptor domain-containing protein [Lysobacter lactosilyticus]MCC8362839.1 toll/interleukin-1 receptor domain-containing protein [Lysobacter lactosilyticus]